MTHLCDANDEHQRFATLPGISELCPSINSDLSYLSTVDRVGRVIGREGNSLDGGDAVTWCPCSRFVAFRERR